MSGDSCKWNGKSKVGGSAGPDKARYKDVKLSDAEKYQIEVNKLTPMQKLESKDVPLTQKPAIFSQEFRKGETPKNNYYDYSNMNNNFDGEKTILDADGNVIQDLNIKGKNLSAAQTTIAFTLNDNEKSTLTLSEKSRDWGKNFDFVDGDMSGDVTEKEYLAMLNNYAKDANAKLGTERVLNETVLLDENEVKNQKALFTAMAGEDGVLSKEEYTGFYDGLMKLGSKDENGNLTVSGKQFNDYVNSKITPKEIAETPLSVDVAAVPSKEEFVNKYNLDIDPKAVSGFKAADNGLEITLKDGTVLKNDYRNRDEQIVAGANRGTPKIYYSEDGSLVFEGLQGYRNGSAAKTAGNRTLRIFPGEASAITLKDCVNITYQSLGGHEDNLTLENTRASMLIMGGGKDKITFNNSTRNDVRRSVDGDLNVSGDAEVSGSNIISVDKGTSNGGVVNSAADKDSEKKYNNFFRESTL